MTDRPKLDDVLETVVYYTDEAEAERFYSEVLGMRQIVKKEGHYLFYKAGPSTFLLFKRETARPLHGATGPVHTAFIAAPGEYDQWKEYLKEQGFPVLHEIEWPERDYYKGKGMRSFYFNDPDGNLLEISNQDIWPD